MIQSNHGKTFGAYTAIPYLLGDRIWKKNIEGRRSFTYFFENLNLRVCRPRKEKLAIDKMFFGQSSYYYILGSGPYTICLENNKSGYA